MSKVFVVQRPAYYDRGRKGWVNKFDLTPAAEFGELIYMLRPGNVFRDRLDEALVRLETCLEQFTAEDYILAVGDPVAISASVMVASRNSGGTVSVLKFDRMANSYQSYPIVIK